MRSLPLSSSLLLILLALPAVANDKEPALKNPQAQSALAQLQKDLDTAEEARRKAATKAIQAAVPKLEKALKETMAKGDLEGANAIKAKVDALKADLEALKEEPAPAAPARAARGLNPTGSWKVPVMNRISEYLPNGTCRAAGLFADPKAFPDNGTWKRLPDGSVEVRWDSGWINRLRPVKDQPNQMEVEGINPKGENVGKSVWDLMGSRK